MTDDRKQRQRIARRKEKVQRSIVQQEARLAALRPEAHQRWQDYLRTLSWGRNKLRRLKRELLALEAAGGDGQ
ncbi:MAG: hypothetical protein QME77_14220 [bacterium]|nr:hypothetical protein [bacterium]